MDGDQQERTGLDERAHVLQLWVNLPAGLKMTGTR